MRLRGRGMSLDPGGRRFRIAGLGLAVAAGACATDPPSAGPVVRDSAGVAIVELSSPAGGSLPAWRVGPVRVDIGVVEGDPAYELQFVAGGVLLDDGRMAVANAGTAEIRVYDSTGLHLFSTGRDGEGPGEFRNLGWVQRYGGDSLAAFDRSLRRLSVFDLAGRVGRVASLVSPGDGRSPNAIGITARGGLVVHAATGLTPQAGEGLHRLPSWVLVYDGDGSVRDSLREIPDREWIIVSVGNATTLMPRPMGARTVVATDGRRVVIGDSDRYELFVYAVDGPLERVVRIARPPTPVRDTHIDAVTDAALARARADRLEETRARYRAIDFPDRLPMFDRLFLDRAGNIWVRDFRLPGAEADRYLVLDSAGTPIATAEMPTRLAPMDIGADYVVAHWRDEVDVEHVRVLELIKTL